MLSWRRSRNPLLARVGLPVLGPIVALLACVALAIPLLASHADAATASSQKKDVYDYALLIDVSRSMIGQGSGSQGQPADIFDKVKASANDFISQLEVGNSTVYVYPFGEEVGKGRAFPLTSEKARRDAEAYVQGLKVQPTWGTRIYDALGQAMTALSSVREKQPDERHVQRIVLFTDGRDNRSDLTFAEITDRFKLEQGKNPYLYLTSIGPQGDIPIDPPPQLRSVRISPAQLDFGSYSSAGKQTRRLDIQFDDRLAGSTLSLRAVSDSASSRGGLVTVTPSSVKLSGPADANGMADMKADVTLVVDNRESLGKTADYGGEIQLRVDSKDLAILSPQALSFTFTMAPTAEVTIRSGAEKLTAELGAVNPYEGDERAATVERKINAEFNASAVAEGASVVARLVRGPSSAEADLQLVGAADSGSSVTLTPDQPSCTLRLTVPTGQAAGDYSYALTFEPSPGASIAGVPVDGKSGAGTVPVTFTVPEQPAPAWQTALRWVGIAIVALLVVLAIIFVILCFVTGVGPATLAALLLRRLRPRIGKWQVEVIAPSAAMQQYDLTGQRRFDLGPDRPGLGALPFTLRFEPRIMALQGKDEVCVDVVGDGGTASIMTLRRASTGLDELVPEATLGAEDQITVELSDGSRCALVFHSSKYFSA